jgi:hypothetical protein
MQISLQFQRYAKVFPNLVGKKENIPKRRSFWKKLISTGINMQGLSFSSDALMQFSKLRFICTRKWKQRSWLHMWNNSLGYSQNSLLVSKDYHHGGRWNAGFYVHHFVKDLGIALHECQQMGISLPGLALVSPLPCDQSIGVIISVYWRICSREWAC